MFDPPWPPPGPGPRQPRDAHGRHWSNDVRRACGGRGRPVSDLELTAWWDLPGGEPATRRRSPDEGRHGELEPRPVDGPGPGVTRRPIPARWVPEEEWIPDPSPAPEQRWTPERDWLSVFADRADRADRADAPASPTGATHGGAEHRSGRHGPGPRGLRRFDPRRFDPRRLVVGRFDPRRPGPGQRGAGRRGARRQAGGRRDAVRRWLVGAAVAVPTATVLWLVVVLARP